MFFAQRPDLKSHRCGHALLGSKLIIQKLSQVITRDNICKRKMQMEHNIGIFTQEASLCCPTLTPLLSSFLQVACLSQMPSLWPFPPCCPLFLLYFPYRSNSSLTSLPLFVMPFCSWFLLIIVLFWQDPLVGWPLLFLPLSPLFPVAISSSVFFCLLSFYHKCTSGLTTSGWPNMHPATLIPFY